MLAFILLIPLAVTSNQSMTRRLGRSWKRLHRLAYVIPCLGILHFWWLVKADIREPLLYAVLLIALLLSRVRATPTPALRSAKDT
jgi:sulfoxide reductase heme-binding subunit YedZ